MLLSAVIRVTIRFMTTSSWKLCSGSPGWHQIDSIPAWIVATIANRLMLRIRYEYFVGHKRAI